MDNDKKNKYIETFLLEFRNPYHQLKDEELKLYHDFADSLNDEDFLLAFDPENYSDSQGYLPNVARMRFRLPDFRRFVSKSSLAEEFLQEPTCGYCVDGDVFGHVIDENECNYKDLGRCLHCSGGDAEPSADVIAIAQSRDWSCVRTDAHIGLLAFMAVQKSNHGMGFAQGVEQATAWLLNKINTVTLSGEQFCGISLYPKI